MRTLSTKSDPVSSKSSTLNDSILDCTLNQKHRDVIVIIMITVLAAATPWQSLSSKVNTFCRFLLPTVNSLSSWIIDGMTELTSICKR